MAKKIQIKRGLKANLPVLAEGEFAWCTDTKELFIGTKTGNILIYPSNNSGGSVVVGSTTNGNIKVNGQELKVFDDSTLKSAMGDKADKNHTHGIVNLTDVDATDKTEGNVLMFDAATSKFKSKPLPPGNGSGATNLGGLTDVDNSIVPTNGDVLQYESGKWRYKKPTGNSNSGNAYMIELNKWGIKKGSFGKPPYTKEQWETAYNNLLGFNKVLEYAKAEGFNTIVVPTGNYSFCYTNLNGGSQSSDMQNTSIKLFSNQTLDLNNSTFEIMYDSINRNPYDKAPVTTPVWKLSGAFITIHECFNSHVKNGKIIGDIPNRSFSDGGIGFNGEQGMEHTYGIAIDFGSSYCSVESMDVSMFMGDGVVIGASSVKSNWYISQYDPVASPGYVDSATGTIIAKDGCYVSGKCILKPEHTLLQMKCGWGYSRIPKFKNRYFEYVFFDATDKVIERKKAVYLQTIKVPNNASYLHIQFFNENIGMANFKEMYIIAKPQGHHITIENCDIHNNHRGGISGGADFTIIRHNRIFHNGMDSGIGIPLFPDTTRYAINFEDSYSNHLTIEENQIFSGFNCILLGVYHANVKGNYISEFASTAFTVYNNAYCIIEDNKLYNTPLLSLSSCIEFQDRDIVVKNNRMYGGMITTINTTAHLRTKVKVIENKIFADQFTAKGNVDIIDNHFKSYSGKLIDNYTGICCNVTNFIGNTLEDYNDGKFFRCWVIKYDSKSIIKDNIFNSVAFNFAADVNKLEYVDCDFYNCNLETHIKDKTLSSSIDFTRCSLVDTRIIIGGDYVNNATTGGVTIAANFLDCSIELVEGGTYSLVVEIGDNVSDNALNVGVIPRKYEVNIKNSKIKNGIVSKNVNFVAGHETMTSKKTTIDNSVIEIADITKFDFMKLGRAADYSVAVKNSQKIGFTSFVKPKYVLLEDHDVSYIPYGATPPTLNLKIGMPFFSTTLNKPLFWNGTEWV